VKDDGKTWPIEKANFPRSIGLLSDLTPIEPEKYGSISKGGAIKRLIKE